MCTVLSGPPARCRRLRPPRSPPWRPVRDRSRTPAPGRRARAPGSCWRPGGPTRRAAQVRTGCPVGRALARLHALVVQRVVQHDVDDLDDPQQHHEGTDERRRPRPDLHGAVVRVAVAHATTVATGAQPPWWCPGAGLDWTGRKIACPIYRLSIYNRRYSIEGVRMGNLAVLGLRIVLAIACRLAVRASGDGAAVLGGPRRRTAEVRIRRSRRHRAPGHRDHAGHAVCVWRLLTMVRRGTVFSHAAFRYVDIVIGAIAAASVLRSRSPSPWRRARRSRRASWAWSVAPPAGRRRRPRRAGATDAACPGGRPRRRGHDLQAELDEVI